MNKARTRAASPGLAERALDGFVKRPRDKKPAEAFGFLRSKLRHERTPNAIGRAEGRCK
jgi:hypothetical protein